MLIDEHESGGVFHQHIKFVQHADDLKLLRRARLEVLIGLESLAWNSFCRRSRSWGEFDRTFAAQSELCFELRQLARRTSAKCFMLGHDGACPSRFRNRRAKFFLPIRT